MYSPTGHREQVIEVHTVARLRAAVLAARADPRVEAYGYRLVREWVEDGVVARCRRGHELPLARVIGHEDEPAVRGLVCDDARDGVEPVADLFGQVGGGQVEKGADVGHWCLLVTGPGQVRPARHRHAADGD